MRTVERAAAAVVGQAIQTARLRKGLHRTELAERTGIAAGSLQGYELGKVLPRAELRATIADALGVARHHFDPPNLIEATPDEVDLIAAYRRITASLNRTRIHRVMAEIEAGREVSAC